MSLSNFSIENAIEYINDAAVRGSQLGLDRVRLLCELLGSPHENIKCVHIAGTNGKGSTACFISSILSEAGLRTGFYYSPAMTGTKDHYMINGELISDEDYAWCVNRVKKANDELYDRIAEYATQFELETAIAFLYFVSKKCDVAVIETGLGGKDDATNICTDKAMCVLTSISLDHTAILGNTIGEIASVKAGIITCACPVVMLDSGEEACAAVKKKCEEQGNELYIVNRHKACELDINIGLLGDFQKENALVALTAAKVLSGSYECILPATIQAGLEKAYWPFRMEKINNIPGIYVDGAHNPDAAYKLKSTMEKAPFKQKKCILILGMFADKDYDKVISILTAGIEHLYCITVPNPQRALNASAIAEYAAKYINKGSITVCDSMKECVEQAVARCNEVNITQVDGAYILACGSLSYLHEFRKTVNNCFGEEKDS